MQLIKSPLKRLQFKLFQRKPAIVHVLRSFWPDIAGGLANDTLPFQLRKNVLTVLVKDSSTIEQGIILKEELKKRLGELFPRILIKEVVFKVGDLEEEKQKAEKKAPEQPKPLWMESELPQHMVDEIESILEKCHEDLKPGFRKLLEKDYRLKLWDQRTRK